MDSLRSVWSALDARRRIIVALATVAVFSAILVLARGVGSQDMALLYSGLESQAAGDVVTALDQRGVVHEVRGAAIYVPTGQRDELRMTLAAEGLPANSAQGYELLDSLSGFGTTSQMFDAAYWRAKEGELARTMLASPHIRAARVHISTQSNRPFQRENDTTAAVTVTTVSGRLSTQQAQALRYLVAAAVTGLAAEDVAVIDGAGGLISSTDETGLQDGETRATELRGRAERLLAARVGPGNAVVEVSVETVTETESIVERRVDPDSRIAISTEVEERSNTSQDSRSGDVTVASNLPDGDAAAPDGSSVSENTESRALTNYDVSETSREVLRGPGAVKRLTVAVLVNDLTATDDAGTTTITPRTEEELAAFRDLVASAVGFDETRGDVITIRSMAFEPLPTLGTEAVADTGLPFDMMSLVQLGVLALVALILGLFVVRPILTSSRAAALPPPMPAAQIAAARDHPGGEAPGFAALAAPARIGEEIDAPLADPVERLRRLIEERQDETIQILQSWIEDPEETRQT